VRSILITGLLRDPSIQVGDPRLFRLYDQTPVMERLQLTSKQITFNISGVQRSRFAPKEKFYLMQNSTYMLLFSRNINHLLVIHNCCYDVFWSILFLLDSISRRAM